MASSRGVNPLLSGWDSDYDGRRWFYTYRSTGHVQYRFPCAGDEFPHFVDIAAPPPDLAPEERLESQQQLRRQAAAAAAATTVTTTTAAPRTSTNSSQPVTFVWDDAKEGVVVVKTDSVLGEAAEKFVALYDVSSAGQQKQNSLPSANISIASSSNCNRHSSKMLPHEVRVEAPQHAFDPLGLVAELPTEHTPMSRVELQPEPVEMADNSILAELPARTPLEAKPPAAILPWRPDDSQTQGFDVRRPQQPASQHHHRRAASESRPQDGPEPVQGAGGQPAYLPYIPGPREWAESSSGVRRSTGLAMQRQVSLMMEPKRPPPDLDPSTVPRVLKIANGNSQPRPLERDHHSQPLAPLDPPPPYRLADETPPKPQSPGIAPKFPSVLKPARGKHLMASEQRRSLPPEKKTDIGCFPRSQGVHGSGRPNRPVSLAPTGSTVSLTPAGRQSPYSETERQSGPPGRMLVPGQSSVAAPAYVPYRERPRPAASSLSAAAEGGRTGGRSELAAQTVPGRGPRRNPAFIAREVSPIRSRSESISSCQPPQTPSPMGSVRRGSSNSSLAQGVVNGPWAGNQSPALGVKGPPVPGKIPLQHSSEGTYFTSHIARGSQVEESSLQRLPPQDHPAGLRVAPPKAGQRQSVSVQPAGSHAAMADGRQHRLSLQAPASTSAAWQSGSGPQQKGQAMPRGSVPKLPAAPLQSPVVLWEHRQ
ncbi:hypothetical protein XA68_11485 [Ophiocordyceps unilateralis]|uniref:WW domain-containing protein n=1 Tax=Ophiocordyceps unilateralis TaxID=268505 RepID=A0A2A9PGT9_OPHUN|nr:hypothetical protein XA68_11485 [Ophiocordyceps unilateralis]